MSSNTCFWCTLVLIVMEQQQQQVICTGVAKQSRAQCRHWEQPWEGQWLIRDCQLSFGSFRGWKSESQTLCPLIRVCTEGRGRPALSAVPSGSIPLQSRAHPWQDAPRSLGPGVRTAGSQSSVNTWECAGGAGPAPQAQPCCLSVHQSRGTTTMEIHQQRRERSPAPRLG